MTRQTERYVHALRYRWLNPLYDPLVRVTLRESAFRKRLIGQSRIAAGHTVLDLGCGTGALAIAVQSAHPSARVHGLDGDADVLRRARAKAARARASIDFEHGDATELPYLDGCFDRVVSSLLFHHLRRDDKIRALGEVRRVLREDGELHVADWGRPRTRTMRGAFFLVQLLDGFETTADNVRGLLPDLIRAAGFVEVSETAAFSTLFGTLALYRASKRSG